MNERPHNVPCEVRERDFERERENAKSAWAEVSRLTAENERLRAALQEIHDGIAPLVGWRMRLREIAERALARGEEASSGAPEAIDGDCGLTIEQQAEEAQSQAEYTKRREGGKERHD